MTVLTLSIITAASMKALVFFIYFYLYFQYRERFLGYWTLAWGLIFLQSVFLDPFLLDSFRYVSASIFFQITIILTVLLLAQGIGDFVGTKLPLFWIYPTIIMSCIGFIGVSSHWPAMVSILPLMLINGAIYIYTGIVLFKNLKTKGLGKHLIVFIFIIIGLHQLDFPLFRATDMAPWGYLLDAFFRIVLGIGFLLTYFEKTRFDLFTKEENFRLLAENAKDIIFRYRLLPQPCCDYISPATIDITGFEPDEYYHDPDLLFKIIHPDDKRLLRNFTDLIAPQIPVAVRTLKKDDTIIWSEYHIVPLHDQENNLVAVEGIIRDITARKNLEQELFRLDRLNIVGQMAANIGHEIRNPLTTVHGFLQVLGRKPEVASFHDQFKLMVDELDRTNALITEYLSLSKKRITNLTLQNLNRIIHAFSPLLTAHATSSGKKLELDLAELPDFLLDEKEIRQLILNLTQNGLEAMQSGKTLTIRTFLQDNAAVLAIQDQGHGIPPSVLKKVGIPFFTTKESGTGLGVAICYSIASRHRAKIDIATSLTGTTFFIRFNLSE
ncbi:MAG: multi-sensor signal transduction histidine kinase [Firmicutes bacterium]|nr:multi-sensor signal transduction histidine kinase [Bacillota bacterium]